MKDHQKRLTFAYSLARQRVEKVASRTKHLFDRRAKALPLLPGERVRVRDRNRRGKGKLCTWWGPEPHVISEIEGKAGVVYREQPEKGGRTLTLHRNALKVCTAPPVEAPQPTEPSVKTHGLVPPLIYGFPPEPVARPAGDDRSARVNLGQPLVRYGD